MALDVKARIHSVPRWGWWGVGGVTVLAYLHASKIKKQRQQEAMAAMAAAEARAKAAAQPDAPGGGVVAGAAQWTTSPAGPPESAPPPPPGPPGLGAAQIDPSFFGTGAPATSGGQYYMDTFYPQMNKHMGRRH